MDKASRVGIDLLKKVFLVTPAHDAGVVVP